MIFVDTGVWFASFVASEPDHAAAGTWLDANTHALVTTGYVIDESLMLLKLIDRWSGRSAPSRQLG